MSIQKEFALYVPIKGESVKSVGNVVQNDIGGNKIIIRLTDGKNPIDLTGYTNITFSVLKPDGTYVVDSLGDRIAVVDALQGAVSVVLHDNAINMAGSCMATIEVFSGATRVTSARLSFVVTADLTAGADPASESSYPVLLNLIADISALEASVEAAEALRVTAETGRVNAESGRTTAEGLRVTAEEGRVTAESTRASNETARTNAEGLRSSAETTRLSNESGRVSAESGRVTAESSRVTVEAGRVSAESGRVSAESDRATAETSRSSAESVRSSAETTRLGNENARSSAEEGRVLAENARVSAESNRDSAEDERVLAESSRASAETDRTSAESGRASAESLRATAETGRAYAEGARVSAESVRASAESTRQTLETARISAESGRASAETARTSAESDRVSAESGRVSAEGLRNTAESGRVSAEELRVSAENLRSQMETARKFVGNYDPATAYVVGNNVAHNGSSYRCISDCVGIAPTNTSNWILVASRGLDGEGSGDMLAATYDPTGKAADVYDMSNMIEGVAKKILTATERTKLSGIQEGANNYQHPSTHSADIIVDGTNNKAYTSAEKTKLAGIEAGANAYSHPANHPPSIITQDSSNRFVTDAEKTTWNGKASTDVATTSANGLMSSTDKAKMDGIEAGANNYVHPTTAGNKHIPTGGTVGQILKNTASGTATWQNESVTTIANNLTTTTAGSALDATQGKVLNDIISTMLAVKPATITTTWVGTSAPYTQTISVEGITVNDEPIISPVYSSTLATAILEKKAWGMVSEIETGIGNIVVTCFEKKPTQAINIQIKGV